VCVKHVAAVARGSRVHGPGRGWREIVDGPQAAVRPLRSWLDDGRTIGIGHARSAGSSALPANRPAANRRPCWPLPPLVFGGHVWVIGPVGLGASNAPRSCQQPRLPGTGPGRPLQISSFIADPGTGRTWCGASSCPSRSRPGLWPHDRRSLCLLFEAGWKTAPSPARRALDGPAGRLAPTPPDLHADHPQRTGAGQGDHRLDRGASSNHGPDGPASLPSAVGLVVQTRCGGR